MTRNEVLESLYNLKTKEKAALADYSESSNRQMLQQRIDALDYAMCVISNSGWIPCEDRLPEEYGFYLTSIREKEYNAVSVEVNEFTAARGWDIGKWYEVTAWMPLPEPYKEVDNED